MAGIMMTGVYNHYLTTYASKETSQSDMHKKDDLRNIYKSIVKSNKSAPLVLLGQNDHAEAAAIDLKENARALQGTLSSLNDIGQEGVFGQKTAFSSAEDVATANYIGVDEDAPPSFSLKVGEMAANQINTGTFLPDDETDLADGSYVFNIRMGDNNYELQYSVKPDDSNRDVQERLARLVNKAGIGLNADVQENENGETALILSSRMTGLPLGKDHQFSVSEEAEGGLHGTVSYFGLNNTTQEAKDARFYINGAEKTSTSNRFTLGNYYELTLQRVSGDNEEVIIGLKDDKESLVEHVHSLVDGYNSFIDKVQGIESESFRTGKVLNEAISVARQSLDGKENPIDLKLTEDGHLTFDEEALEKAASTPEGGTGADLSTVRDFAKSLYDKARAIAIDPMQYISRPVVAYKDPDRRDFANPYITSEYSGMMFNNYC